MGDTEILATALNGLTARLDSDAEERRSFAETVEARFRTHHEDARRDRRELIGRIDQWGRGIVGEMRREFKAIDARLNDVCDVGKVEHEDFRQGITALNDWRSAQANQAKGRAQVLGPVLGFLKQHAAVLICLCVAVYTGARDVVPLMIASSSEVASINAVAPFEAAASTPTPPSIDKSIGLRGLSD